MTFKISRIRPRSRNSTCKSTSSAASSGAGIPRIGSKLLVPFLLVGIGAFSALRVDAFQCINIGTTPKSTTNQCTRRSNGTSPKSTTKSTKATTTIASSTSLPCQLLGMNCNTPTDFTFSFRGFTRRGGDTDIHRDGWGLAFYEGRGLRTFHDPQPAADSPIAQFMADYPVKTLNMLAHIRYGTEGKTCLENVHPFERELWGIKFCFAHNGDVPLFKGNVGRLPQLGIVNSEGYGQESDNKGSNHQERIFNPVGDTDSEAIFCALLNSLRDKFDTLPSLPVLHDTLRTLCDEIVQHDPDLTILNFLMGCGENVQFAFSWPGARPGSDVWNGLYYIVREPPFTVANLTDCDYSIDFAAVTTPEDRVAVIATKPLTMNEEWVELRRGELILFDDGLPHLEPAACFGAELKGHGLKSEVIPCPKLEEDMRRYNFFQGAGI